MASGGRCAAGDQVLSVNYGEELKITLKVEIDKSISGPHLYMAFYDKEQRNFAEIYSSNGNFVIENKPGWIKIEATIPSINFSQGIYSVTVAISERKGGHVIFRQQSAIYFQVVGAQHGWAPIQIRPVWRQINAVNDKNIEVTN